MNCKRRAHGPARHCPADPQALRCLSPPRLRPPRPAPPPPSPPRLRLSQPSGRARSLPPELGGGSEGMAAPAAPGGSGPGTDSRLDQETARWLRWDKVRGARGLGAPGGGAGSSACSPGECRRLRFLPGLPSRGETGGETGGETAAAARPPPVRPACCTCGACPGKAGPAPNQRAARPGLPDREAGGERWARTRPVSGSCLTEDCTHSDPPPAARPLQWGVHPPPPGIVPSRPCPWLLGTLQTSLPIHISQLLSCKHGLGPPDFRHLS